jgi:hypothetical protein
VSIPLAVLEAITDASGIALRIEVLLPAGVRHRQLRVRTLILGMLLPDIRRYARMRTHGWAGRNPSRSGHYVAGGEGARRSPALCRCGKPVPHAEKEERGRNWIDLPRHARSASMAPGFIVMSWCTPNAVAAPRPAAAGFEASRLRMLGPGRQAPRVVLAAAGGTTCGRVMAASLACARRAR